MAIPYDFTFSQSNRTPRLSYPLPHPQSELLWRKVRTSPRGIKSIYIGVDELGRPFHRSEGGVMTHFVVASNDKALILDA